MTDRCDFHDAYDTEGQPTGERCIKDATHLIEWHDSQQYSMACEEHSRPAAILWSAPSYTVSTLADNAPVASFERG